MIFQIVRLMFALIALSLSITGIVKASQLLQLLGQILGLAVIVSFAFTGI